MWNPAWRGRRAAGREDQGAHLVNADVHDSLFCVGVTYGGNSLGLPESMLDREPRLYTSLS